MAELRFFLFQFALLFFQIRFLALQLGQAVCQFLDLILILRLDATSWYSSSIFCTWEV